MESPEVNETKPLHDTTDLVLAAAVIDPPLPGIDSEDPNVVPSALTAFVAAGRHAYAAMHVNGHYPPAIALTAVEDLAALLERMSADVALYVGDFSSKGGLATARAEKLVAQARTELSEARHHLFLDEDSATRKELTVG